MTPIKKAFILSLGLHLIGLSGGKIPLKETKPKQKEYLYSIQIIEIVEESPKPPAKPLISKKPETISIPPERPKPKVVTKKMPQKPPLKPKKKPVCLNQKKKSQSKIEAQKPKANKEFIELQLQIYSKNIEQLIKKHWFIPEEFKKNLKNLEVIVVLRLKPNGELLDAKLKKCSGFHPFDESTVKAIKKVAPFPPLPSDLEEGCKFEIVFYSDQLI